MIGSVGENLDKAGTYNYMGNSENDDEALIFLVILMIDCNPELNLKQELHHIGKKRFLYFDRSRTNEDGTTTKSVVISGKVKDIRSIQFHYVHGVTHISGVIIESFLDVEVVSRYLDVLLEIARNRNEDLERFLSIEDVRRLCKSRLIKHKKKLLKTSKEKMGNKAKLGGRKCSIALSDNIIYDQHGDHKSIRKQIEDVDAMIKIIDHIGACKECKCPKVMRVHDI